MTVPALKETPALGQAELDYFIVFPIGDRYRSLPSGSGGCRGVIRNRKKLLAIAIRAIGKWRRKWKGESIKRKV